MKSRKQYYLHGLYSYIKDIGDRAINSGMDIIIWGYSKGGAFLRYLLENYDQRIHIAYIIDQAMQIPVNCEPKIYRSSILEYIDGSKYILLSTIKSYQTVCKVAESYGFVEGRNLFDVRSKIGVSYIDYLQISNGNLDFTSVTEKERPDVYSKPDIVISTPFEMTCLDRVFNEIIEIEDDIKFFDYGCGKGQVLLAAYINGIDKIKGIELVPEIANMGMSNMAELHIPGEIICGDATTYNDIDDVNVFFFNNPFTGSVFERVYLNIADSYGRNKRRIHIIYLNPYCNSIIKRNELFKLKRQLYVDMGDPLANIYSNE